MTAIRHLPRFLAATVALLLLAASPVRAVGYDYNFVIANFTDAATLTVSFNGTDANGDGLITGFYVPDNTSGSPFPNELSALSLSFSGNTILPAFDVASTDFTDIAQSLSFPSGGSYFLELIYVLDGAGTGVTDQALPPGTATGDGLLYLQGAAGPDDLLAVGTNCGGFGGATILASGTCGGVQVSNGDVNSTDIATYDVPEPATMLLFASALGFLAIRRRA
jgi:hypothetical protein